MCDVMCVPLIAMNWNLDITITNDQVFALKSQCLEEEKKGKKTDVKIFRQRKKEVR